MTVTKAPWNSIPQSFIIALTRLHMYLWAHLLTTFATSLPTGMANRLIPRSLAEPHCKVPIDLFPQLMGCECQGSFLFLQRSGWIKGSNVLKHWLLHWQRDRRAVVLRSRWADGPPSEWPTLFPTRHSRPSHPGAAWYPRLLLGASSCLSHVSSVIATPRSLL